MAIRKKDAKKVETRGRPATGRARDRQMILRFTEAERAAIAAAADAQGQLVTVWARAQLLAAAGFSAAEE